MSNDDSYVVAGKHGTTFVGADATKLYSVMALKSALGLYYKTKMKITRHVGIKGMLISAGQVTGKTYKTSQPEIMQAINDLDTWINNMKSALPVVSDGIGSSEDK